MTVVFQVMVNYCNEIPSYPWEIISTDLIGELPEYACRLTKMIRVIATHVELNSEGAAVDFHDKVFRYYSLPHKIISDCGPQFVSKFTKALYKLLGITGNPSTAYHPQTDRQTERVNQEIEQYLRIFVNHHQNDWSK
jgi:hypothetical protein